MSNILELKMRLHKRIRRIQTPINNNSLERNLISGFRYSFKNLMELFGYISEFIARKQQQSSFIRWTVSSFNQSCLFQLTVTFVNGNFCGNCVWRGSVDNEIWQFVLNWFVDLIEVRREAGFLMSIRVNPAFLSTACQLTICQKNIF